MSDLCDLRDDELLVRESRPDTLSVTEAARLMRLGVDAIRSLIATGDLPALSLNRKHCVLLRDQVLEFIRSSAQEQALQRRSRLERGTSIPELNSDEFERTGRRGRPRRKLPAIL